MTKPLVPSVTVRNITLKAGDPKICVSISDKYQEDILASCRNIIKERADLVEWRADFYKDYTSDIMVKDTLEELREILGDTPLIFTLRSTAEEGRAELKLWDHIRLYREAAKTGNADLLDIEYKIMLQLPKDVVADIKKYSKIIVSKHNFKSTPGYDVLVDDIIRLQVAGGDIAKLAVMPFEEDDVARLIMASKEIIAHYTTTPIITISMGVLGIETRVRCVETGSCITFAAVGRASAPGQLPIRMLKEELDEYRYIK